MAQKEVDLKEFVRRVERLCDFFLSKVPDNLGKDAIQDLRIIQDLKEDALNIQFDTVEVIGAGTFEGLHDYMTGA